MRGTMGWVMILVLALAGGAGLGWRHVLNAERRMELEAGREKVREADRLRSENQRLAAGLPTAEAWSALRTDRATAVKLRAEIETLRTEKSETERRATEKKSQLPERFGAGVAIPASEWKNAGAATPAAALETALWAAAGGDVDAFARRIFLGGNALTAARELLEGLAPDLRAQLNSPEKLVAFLTIKDVPTGEAKVREWSNLNERTEMVEVALLAPDGRGREVRLLLVRPTEHAEWKLGVSSEAVAKLASTLRGR